MGLDASSADSSKGPKYLYPTGISDGTFEGNWYGRKIPEQCDNGGNLMADYAHGCDRLCQVMAGWDCYHYFKEFETAGYEVPIYASKCEPQAASHEWRRRLEELGLANETGEPALIDPLLLHESRRILDHVDVSTYFYGVCTNNNDFELNHLIFHPKLGLNG